MTRFRGNAPSSMHGSTAALLTLPAAAVASLLLSGCSTDARGHGPFEMDALPQARLEERLRIGSLEDPDLGFSRVSEHAEISAGDTLWIAELSVPEVRVYSPEGELVRRIGRRGDGPGEMRSIGRWGLLGDTLWISDGSLRRIMLFRRDGTTLGTVRGEGFTVNADPYVVTYVPAELRSDGGFNSAFSNYSVPPTTRMGDMPERTADIPRVVFDATGAPRDTVGFFSMTMGGPFPDGYKPVMVGSYEVGVSSPLPWRVVQLIVGLDTIVVEQPDPRESLATSILIHRIGSTGDTLFTRTLEYLPRAVPTSFTDSVIGARLESARRSGEDPQALERALRTTTMIPRHYPPIASIKVARDGSIWLLRAEPGDTRTWVVLEGDGTPRGRVSTVPGATLLASDGHTALFRVIDEFDVPWVVWYRMERG